MLKIDLEEFVASGCFGCLGRAPSRELVIETLGRPDSDRYPAHDQYGNVSFEFDTTLNCICGVVIAFPHALNYEQLKQNAWPDSRFQFKAGRFQPGLKFRQVTGSLPGFEHADTVGANPNCICVYTNRKNNIDLCFAPETTLGEHTLCFIVSHPEIQNSRVAGA